MKVVLEYWIESLRKQICAGIVVFFDVEQSSQEDSSWMKGEMKVGVDSTSRSSKLKALCANDR